MTLRLSASLLLLASSTLVFAKPATIESVAVINTGKFYAGILGGAGSSNNFDANQFGTAFFTEAAGGPLSVNAVGGLSNHNASFFGIQLGYQTQDIPFSGTRWTFSPAAELEGFLMGRHSYEGTLVNNAERLPEHDFVVSYPTRKSVFLANAVLNFDHPCFPVQPYVGFGIGNAILRISDATSTQINPPELNINHYNGTTSDATSTFAGQIKLGLNYDIFPCLSVFAEYRWLYLASTQFLFGSTVYPGHAETSSWQVKLDAQRYNLGNVGIRINW